MKKRNQILLILGGVLFLLAIVALIVANVLMGTNFVELLTSRWALFIYLFLGLYVLIIIFLFVRDKVRKL